MSKIFTIAETAVFEKTLKKNKSLEKIYRKIVEETYPILRINPYFGPNIKGLKGEFSGVYRYRIGKYRLFYSVNEDEVIVFIIDLRLRQSAYK